jgi:putative transposase
VPLSIAVAGANTPDMRLVAETLDGIPISRPHPRGNRRQHLCLDKGYAFDSVGRVAEDRSYTIHIPHKRKRGEPAAARPKHPGGKARRWVNERTHSWFNRFRRVLVRWEKKAANYLAVLHFVAAYYTFRQAKVFG